AGGYVLLGDGLRHPFAVSHVYEVYVVGRAGGVVPPLPRDSAEPVVAVDVEGPHVGAVRGGGKPLDAVGESIVVLGGCGGHRLGEGGGVRVEGSAEPAQPEGEGALDGGVGWCVVAAGAHGGAVHGGRRRWVHSRSFVSVGDGVR